MRAALDFRAAFYFMAKAQIKIKIKGSASSVQSAINKLAGKDSAPLREGDFRTRAAKENK